MSVLQSSMLRPVKKRISALILATETRIGLLLGVRHLAGARLEEAIEVGKTEAARKRIASVAYWPPPDEKPEIIVSHYAKAIEQISAAGLDSSISVKVDLLNYDRDLFLPILRSAARTGVRVHFDAQAYESVDPTFAIAEEGHRLGARVSVTLPARWDRSVEDAERFIRLGIGFRIVKGQSYDPYRKGIDDRAAYLSLVERACGRAPHVGVATHDRGVAERALDLLITSKTPCSLEQLYAMPRLDDVADSRGVPVRLYLAYGRPGLPYSVRQAFRRPAIVWWMLRDLFRGRTNSPAASR